MDLVRAVLARIGCTRFTLCPWSMAGLTAVAYAATQPPELEKLVLVDIAGLSDPSRGRSGVELLRPRSAAEYAKHRAEVWVHEPGPVRDLVEALDFEELTRSPQAFQRILEDNVQIRHVPPPLPLEAIEVPTLVFSERHSLVMGPAAAHAAAQRLQHARAVIFEKSAHALALEEAEHFQDVIADFVLGEAASWSGSLRKAGNQADYFNMGSRILYLVRHGHYHTDRDGAKYGKLTALGRRQAKRVGKRLASVNLQVMHHSDMVRATETAEIIAGELATAIPTRPSQLLREGVPTVPCPWLPNLTRAEARKHRARMDAAYDRYFKPSRGGQRHEVLVAHANIIRYFISRAMGDSIAKWACISLTQASLTMMSVEPKTRRATLLSFNDVGHLPLKMQTFL